MKPHIPLILLIVFVMSSCAEKQKTLKETVKKPVQLVISPETTFLTEPLLPDGRIDYIAALNERLSAQTTPENNIIVGIFSLVGGETETALLRLPEAERDKESIQYKYRERFWKLLGPDIPPPSLDSLVGIVPGSPAWNWDAEQCKRELLELHSEEELAQMVEEKREGEKRNIKSRFEGGTRVCCGSEYAVAPDGTTKEEYEANIKKIEAKAPDEYYRELVSDKYNESYMQSLSRPWTEEDYPHLARWLATTDELTTKLIDISKQRTGYYHPLLFYEDGSDYFFAIPLPYVQSLRQAARFFQMRGNFEFAKGNLAEAMECAFSAVRMGRTARTGSWSIVEDLVGIAITGMGNYQLTMYLADLPKDKDADWILQKKREYDAIETNAAPLPWLPIWIHGERFGGLSITQAIAVEPQAAYDFLAVDMEYEAENLAQYKELFLSGREYDWNEILKQINLVHDDLEDVCLLPTWQRRFRAAERFMQRLAEHVNLVDVSSATPEQQAVAYLCDTFVFGIGPALIAFARNEWDNRITSVAFALAAYRADHDGDSPNSLEQLVPKYLDKIPDSPFTDKPLRYVRRQNDVLIATDDEYLLDGSEEEVEQRIADGKPGGRAHLSAKQVIFVVVKW
jgi:hypothetical protein